MEEFSFLDHTLFLQGNFLRLASLVRAVHHIRRLCREWKPCVIHCHAFLAGVAARLAAPKGVRLLYSPHAFSVNPRISFSRRSIATISERLLRGRTDTFILVGPGEQADAASLGIPNDRIRLVCNGLPQSIIDEFLPREKARAVLGIPMEERAVVAPCRLEPQKGLAQLLKVWRDLPDARLHIFGDGPMKSTLEAIISKNNLGDSVTMHGVRQNLYKYMLAFDAGILPSLYEGLSYSLLEMLAAGIPVAASDIPANRIADNLHLFPLDDSEAMLNAVRNALASRANAPVFPFSLDRQLDALVDCYCK